MGHLRAGRAAGPRHPARQLYATLFCPSASSFYFFSFGNSRFFTLSHRSRPADAINAILSLAVVALNICYIVPNLCRLTIGRKRFRPGPFTLGKWAYPVGALATLWVGFAVRPDHSNCYAFFFAKKNHLVKLSHAVCAKRAGVHLLAPADLPGDLPHAERARLFVCRLCVGRSLRSPFLQYAGICWLATFLASQAAYFMPFGLGAKNYFRGPQDETHIRAWMKEAELQAAEAPRA